MAPNALNPDQQRRVEAFAPRVPMLARTMARRVSHASFDELQSAGYEGLVHAALRYDPSSGVPFSAFAHYRVRGAMLDAARRAAPEIRRRARALQAFEATQVLLEQAHGRANAPGVVDKRSLRERLDAAAQLVAQATTAVLLSKLPPKDPDSVADRVSPNVEASLLEAEQRAMLERALDACGPDERKLLEALYFEGLSMHDYAKQVGKSVSTVSRHHAKVLARLAALLRAQAGEHRPRPASSAP